MKYTGQDNVRNLRIVIAVLSLFLLAQPPSQRRETLSSTRHDGGIELGLQRRKRYPTVMVYLVTYDLNVPGKNYDNLWSALKQYDYIRDTGLDSVWFVSTSWTANQVSDHLRAHMDDSDRLIVTRLQEGTHQGWLNKDVWKWIEERL